MHLSVIASVIMVRDGEPAHLLDLGLDVRFRGFAEVLGQFGKENARLNFVKSQN